MLHDDFRHDRARAFSFGSKKSKPVFKEFGGLFGLGSGAEQRIGGQAEALAGQLGQGVQGTPFNQAIQQQALNPGAVQLGDVRSGLLNQVADLANQRTAVSGLGPATAQSIASNQLPLLAQFQQQDFQNLLSGQQGVQRGQQLGQQGQAAGLQGLLQLAGLSMPQIVGGQKSSGFNAGIKF